MPNNENQIELPYELEATASKRELFTTCRRLLFGAWWKLLATMLAGFVIGVLIVHLVPHRYTSSIIVRAPSEAGQQSVRGLASLLPSIPSQFSELGKSDFDEFIAVLTSNDLAFRIAARRPEMVRRLFANEWDAKQKKWVDTGAGHIVHVLETVVLARPAWTPPTGEDLRNYIVSHVDINMNAKSGMLEMTYTNRESSLAQEFLSVMHDEADALVRERARIRSQQRLAYLTDLLSRVVQTEQHTTLIELSLAEQRKLMMTQADKYFMAIPVDDPIQSHRDTELTPFIVLFVTTVLGGLASCIWICFDVISGYWSGHRTSQLVGGRYSQSTGAEHGGQVLRL